MASFWPQTLVDYAQVLSAVGTLGAVVAALYISSRSSAVNLSGGAAVVLMIGGVGDHRPRFLRVQTTNRGPSEAVVTGMGWMVTHWTIPGRQYAVQDLSGGGAMRNPPLPKRLQPGEELAFWLPLDGPGNWAELVEQHGMFPDALKTRFDFERLRVLVYTTVGGPLKIKPVPGALDAIWRAQEKFLSAKD